MFTPLVGLRFHKNRNHFAYFRVIKIRIFVIHSSSFYDDDTEAINSGIFFSSLFRMCVSLPHLNKKSQSLFFVYYPLCKLLFHSSVYGSAPVDISRKYQCIAVLILFFCVRFDSYELILIGFSLFFSRQINFSCDFGLPF